MLENQITAVVPIRFLPATKHRLAKHLDAQTRQQLVKAMLVDVIKAINSSQLIKQFSIVTSDKEFLSTLSQSEFDLHKSALKGLNEELSEYITILDGKEIRYAIIILGDLPLLSGTVLDDLIQSGLRFKRPVIAQDWKGTGTNILFFSLPLTFQLQFGRNSLQNHINELQRKGINPIIYHAIETALDIDDEIAIQRLVRLAHLDKKLQRTNTYRLLKVDEKRKGKAA